MMLTDMERRAFRVVVMESFYDVGACATTVATLANIDINKVRGVLSSLVQKDLIDSWVYHVNNRKTITFNPINDEGEAVCFGVDKYTEQVSRSTLSMMKVKLFVLE